MESGWIVGLVKEAIRRHGSPGILNSDQESQFTSDDYINLLKDNNIRMSMDGKNIFYPEKTRDVADYDWATRCIQGLKAEFT